MRPSSDPCCGRTVAANGQDRHFFQRTGPPAKPERLSGAGELRRAAPYPPEVASLDSHRRPRRRRRQIRPSGVEVGRNVVISQPVGEGNRHHQGQAGRNPIGEFMASPSRRNPNYRGRSSARANSSDGLFPLHLYILNYPRSPSNTHPGGALYLVRRRQESTALERPASAPRLRASHLIDRPISPCPN